MGCATVCLIRKGARADRAVMKWISDVEDEDLHLSVLVVGELRQGVEGLRARDDASAQRLDRWLRRLAEAYEGRILLVDEPVAQVWGRLNVPDLLPAVDGLLAAGRLAVVLERSFAGVDLGVHAVYPQGPRPPGKVRALVDLLVQHFRRPAWKLPAG